MANGAGESHYDAFYKFISALSEPDLAAYQRDNREPDGWEGLYTMIRAHPWL